MNDFLSFILVDYYIPNRLTIYLIARIHYESV